MRKLERGITHPDPVVKYLDLSARRRKIDEVGTGAFKDDMRSELDELRRGAFVEVLGPRKNKRERKRRLARIRIHATSKTEGADAVLSYYIGDTAMISNPAERYAELTDLRRRHTKPSTSLRTARRDTLVTILTMDDTSKRAKLLAQVIKNAKSQTELTQYIVELDLKAARETAREIMEQKQNNLVDVVK